MLKILTTLFFLLPIVSYANYSIVVEAENTSYAESIEVVNHENASNGQFIKLKVDETLNLQIDNVTTAGLYQFEIYCFNGGTEQFFHLKVNEGDFTETKLIPSNWAFQGIAVPTTLEINLEEGTNNIILKANENNQLLLDKFWVYDELIPVGPTSYYFSNDGDDSNLGTLESPWKTLQKATQISNGSLVKEGDQILFRKGDTFEGNFVVNCKGTPELPIIIGSYGEGELPVISGSGAIEGGDYMEAMKIVNSSHIVVQELWIKNDRHNMERSGWGHDKSFGIFVTANQWASHPSSNLVFRNLKFSDIFGSELPEDFNALNVTGLRFESDSNKVGKEITIRDVLIEDCYFTNIGKAGVWSIHKGKNTEVDSVNRSINFTIRNNTFQNTGGSGIILSKVHNALVENNLFDHTGYSSEEEPRLVGRGSGMWVFSARNIIAQYNTSLSIRGPNDSYGLHIDFGNKNIIYQYNYTEDCEGGFVEILGDNYNVAYRFNVSVNDGFRDFHGNILWTSGFVGSRVVDGKKEPNPPIPSDSVYIYNNTVFLDKDYNPDISMFSKNTYVYNNIFVHEGNGRIGDIIEMDMEEDFIVSNNLYFGNINADFSNLDENATTRNPLFINKGVSNKEGYQIEETSSAIDNGKSFPEPSFPQLGHGIFKDVSFIPNKDIFGNPINIATTPPNIGADNNYNNTGAGPSDDEISFDLHENELNIGETLQLSVLLNGENIQGYEVIYESNVGIVTVDEEGVVTALESGEAIITASVNELGIETSTTLTIFEEEVTSIVENREAFKIFPNPASDKITVLLKGDALQEIRLYNLIGHQVFITVAHEKVVINLQDYPKGIYILEVNNAHQKTQQKKIIIE